MFLIQDGHQTHTRVAEAAASGHTDGVIWSLGDQTPANLDDVLSAPCMAELVQAIDPQLFVAPLQDANPKKLLDHGLFRVPMVARDFAARHVVGLVDEILRFQAERPVTHVVSPTVPVSSMGDRWAQIAADLADTSLANWANRDDARPLYVSVAVQESLLSDDDNVAALLDELTSYDCEGFYLLFELDPDLDSAQGAAVLERALYIVYTLAELNDFTVWVGYAGLAGYAFRAVGATAFGAGWFRKQQWWSPSHWTGSGGGRQPLPRIYLDTLLGSLRIDAELQAVARQRTDGALFDDLTSGEGQMAQRLRTRRSFDGTYPRAELTAQLFAVCRELDSRIVGDVRRDVETVLDGVIDAELVHRRIRDVNVELDARSSSTALTTWKTALTALGQRPGVAF